MGRIHRIRLEYRDPEDWSLLHDNATAFVLSIKSHTRYFGCNKCLQKSKYLRGKLVYLSIMKILLMFWIGKKGRNSIKLHDNNIKEITKMIEDINNWKATEFRQFLLYEMHLNMYAKRLIEYFIVKYKKIYGKEYITYNVHNLYFFLLQLIEYINSPFNIADSIYGILFLSVCLIRLYNIHFSSYFGFEAAS
ncbi:COX3 oxidase, partial [Acromyrmex charruanus]